MNKTLAKAAAVLLSFSLLGTVITLASRSDVEPELTRILGEAGPSVSRAHLLCFAAIEDDLNLLDECLSEADQAVKS